MSDRMDYYQYYLSKCKNKELPTLVGKRYKTTDGVRDAFKNSTCYLKNPDDMNFYLIQTLSSYISEEAEDFSELDKDADRVLQRSINRITNARENEDIFEAISDFLWVKASVKLCEINIRNGIVSLTNIFYQEIRVTMEWLDEIIEKIKDAEYDLECMEESNRLPIGKQIFLGLVENPDVAWYANPHNILHSEKMQKISDCREYIRQLEMIYFAFLVTNIYREDIRKRYR